MTEVKRCDPPIQGFPVVYDKQCSGPPEQIVSYERSKEQDFCDVVNLRHMLLYDDSNWPDKATQTLATQEECDQAMVVSTQKEGASSSSRFLWVRRFLDSMDSKDMFVVRIDDNVTVNCTFHHALKFVRKIQTAKVVRGGELTMATLYGTSRKILPVGEAGDLFALFWYAFFDESTVESCELFKHTLMLYLKNEIQRLPSWTFDEKSMYRIVSCATSIIANANRNREITYKNARHFFSIFGPPHVPLLSRMQRMQTGLMWDTNDDTGENVLTPLFCGNWSRSMMQQLVARDKAIALWIDFTEREHGHSPSVLKLYVKHKVDKREDVRFESFDIHWATDSSHDPSGWKDYGWYVHTKKGLHGPFATVGQFVRRFLTDEKEATVAALPLCL